MILIAAICIALLGLILLILGRRAKTIDDHPHCVHCRYDLIGKPETSTACPECGADLSKPKAIRQGLTKRSPLPMAFGALLIAVALAITGIHSSQNWIAWDPYKPAWLLRWEMAAANPPLSFAAYVELLERIKDGRLTGSALRGVIDNALTQQADRTHPCDKRYSNLIEAAFVKDLLLPTEFHRYFESISFYQFSCRSQMRIAGEFFCKFEFEDRTGDILKARTDSPHRKVSIAMNLPNLSVDPLASLDLELSSHAFIDAWLSDNPLRNLPTGDYPAVFEITVSMDWNGMHHAWTRTQTATIHIFSPDQSPVHLVTDPALAPAMHEGISLTLSEATMPVPRGGFVYHLYPVANHLPASGVFLPTITDGQHEISFDQPLYVSTTNDTDFIYSISDIQIDMAHAEVILRPDAASAAEMDIEKIWGKEIRYKHSEFAIK